jgi:hypothetical protein
MDVCLLGLLLVPFKLDLALPHAVDVGKFVISWLKTIWQNMTLFSTIVASNDFFEFAVCTISISSSMV